MTDFIQELTVLINDDMEALLPAKMVTINPESVKKMVITAADNTLKAAVAGQHQDRVLIRKEIAYIVAALTVGQDKRILKTLHPKG